MADPLEAQEARMAESSKRFCLQLPPVWIAAIREAAEARGQSSASWVRGLIYEGIARGAKK